MPAVRKKTFKNMEVHSFLGLLSRSRFDLLKDVKKAEFKICFGERNLNEEQRSTILQTNKFPRQTQIHRYAEFSQNIDWIMMLIIYLKMRNPGL